MLTVTSWQLYRRPIDRPYAISEFATDNLDFITTWPMRAAVGGNFGVPGRFIGVDVSDLTGGALVFFVAVRYSWKLTPLSIST